MTLRVHHIEEASKANGPGTRFVIWVQGCPFRCPGCFNPETHDFRGGSRIRVDEIVEHICQRKDIEGITISGGEPLHPAHRIPLLVLLADIRRYRPNLSVIIFSGFGPGELNNQQRELLALCDTAILGRYRQEQRVARGLIGSANKALWHFTDRYSDSDFTANIPEAEIWIDPDGSIHMSGIDPLTI